MNVKETIKKFDEYLLELNLNLEAIIIGGAALVLLDVVERATRARL